MSATFLVSWAGIIAIFFLSLTTARFRAWGKIMYTLGELDAKISEERKDASESLLRALSAERQLVELQQSNAQGKAGTATAIVVIFILSAVFMAVLL